MPHFFRSYLSEGKKASNFLKAKAHDLSRRHAAHISEIPISGKPQRRSSRVESWEHGRVWELTKCKVWEVNNAKLSLSTVEISMSKYKPPCRARAGMGRVPWSALRGGREGPEGTGQWRWERTTQLHACV